VEGWACWRAAQGAVRGGMVAPHVDATAALALAAAAGVPAGAAAELILAVQDGLHLGLAKTKEGKG
jgi:hypothetical protein